MSFVSAVVLESIALDPDINFIVFEADKKMRILFSFTSTFKFELITEGSCDLLHHWYLGLLSIWLFFEESSCSDFDADEEVSLFSIILAYAFEFVSVVCRLFGGSSTTVVEPGPTIALTPCSLFLFAN